MTPPTVEDRLRAAALVLYETDPLVDEGFSRILGRETYEISADHLAALLEPFFVLRHRLAWDDYGRRVVVRVRPGEPHVADPVTRPELTALVCQLLTRLPDPPRTARLRLREAVKDVRELAREATPRRPRNGQGRPRGARSRLVGDVVSNVLEALDDVPEFRGRVERPGRPAKPRPPAPKPEAAPDPAHLEATARRFLAELVPGRHPVAETWAAYAEATPAADRLGKHAFGALARDVLGEPRKIRGVRLWTVPEPAVIAEVAERVARLTWEEQRPILLRIVQRQAERTAA